MKTSDSPTCPVCEREFATPRCMQVHVTTVHGPDKPFACQFCSHRASRKAQMQLHLRTHTGEKPYRCDYCPYAAGDHNALRRHKATHTGKKPYACPHCSYTCIQSAAFKLHLERQHPRRSGVFSCTKCPYQTVNETLWLEHMRDHDNGIVEDHNYSLPPPSSPPLVDAHSSPPLGDAPGSSSGLIHRIQPAKCPKVVSVGAAVPVRDTPVDESSLICTTTVTTRASCAEGKAGSVSCQSMLNKAPREANSDIFVIVNDLFGSQQTSNMIKDGALNERAAYIFCNTPNIPHSPTSQSALPDTAPSRAPVTPSDTTQNGVRPGDTSLRRSYVSPHVGDHCYGRQHGHGDVQSEREHIDLRSCPHSSEEITSAQENMVTDSDDEPIHTFRSIFTNASVEPYRRTPNII